MKTSWNRIASDAWRRVVVKVLPMLFVWTWSPYWFNRVLLSYAGLWFTWISTFLEKFAGAELVFTGDDVRTVVPPWRHSFTFAHLCS
jgi:hypothetical protein